MSSKSKRTWLLMTALLVVSLLAAGAWTWADARHAGEAVALEAYDSTVRSLVEPERIEMVADVLISADGEAGRPAWTTTATYRYWQDGERFRVSVEVAEEDSPLAADADVSWDGETFYFLLAEDGVLSLSAELPRQLPLSLPHPLMLPLDSLSPDRAGCDGCAWLPTVLRRGGELADRLRSVSVSSAPWRLAGASISGARQLALTVATGRDEGRQMHDEVTLARQGERWLVERIERFDEGGRSLSTLSFDRFRGASGEGGHLYPRLVELEVAAVPERHGALRSLFAVRELAVDAPMDPTVLDLTREEPARIWDSDAEMFLR